MNLTFPASYLQAKLNAEWNFRVSKGYVKDTFWNHLRFRLTDRD